MTPKLAVALEIDSCLSESERILNEHLELANQIKVKKKNKKILKTNEYCMYF